MSKKSIIKLIYTDKELIQKTWQMFRIGQTMYVSYLIGLINFTLILYNLGGVNKYLEPLPFAVILLIILVPLGIFLGVMHVRKQIPVEVKILTHHNPYVYKIIANSKEAMAVKTALWQFDVTRTQNDFLILQSDMNKKLWSAINEITKKEVFTKEDMEKIDKIKSNFNIIELGIIDRKDKYKQLYQGFKVKDIPGAEETIEL